MITQKQNTYTVKLPLFEGPLDLLLHLVKENEMDISNIEIAQVTKQYLQYLELMQFFDLEIAGEFFVMAATLMHIKSRMLLPVVKNDSMEDEGKDPREELIQRLIEYKKFKEITKSLRDLEVRERDVFVPQGLAFPEEEDTEKIFSMQLFDLVNAFHKVLKQLPQDTFRELIPDEVTVEEKIAEITLRLEENSELLFTTLLRSARTRLHIIVVFLALLELTKQHFVRIIQHEKYDEIKIVKIGRLGADPCACPP